MPDIDFRSNYMSSSTAVRIREPWFWLQNGHFPLSKKLTLKFRKQESLLSAVGNTSYFCNPFMVKWITFLAFPRDEGSWLMHDFCASKAVYFTLGQYTIIKRVILLISRNPVKLPPHTHPKEGQINVRLGVTPDRGLGKKPWCSVMDSARHMAILVG